jgi:hypothetical protein
MMSRLTPFLALVCVVGCSAEKEVFSSDPRETLRPPLSDAGEPSVTGMVVDASAPSIDAGVSTRADAATDAPAVAPELCDGVDNDRNGTVDDVDVGNDGVCDCLLIATLGKAGGSGQGDVFGGWLDARSDNGAADLADQTLTPELLARYQVIVAQDVHDQRAYSAAEIDALQRWVENGGGLLTLIGYAGVEERTNANAILARFGLDYGAKPILPRSGGKTVAVKTWVPHPVTTGVTSVGVDNGYEVGGDGTALASEGGFTLLRAKEVGRGHVLAWGDEWITYNTEWSSNAGYQVEPLWLNMIKWLTAAKVCQVPPPALL